MSVDDLLQTCRREHEALLKKIQSVLQADQLERPVLLLESPQNAPAGGAYLLALYPGQAAVHQVDCYWQRQADASLPLQAALLFDRGGIPQDTRLEQLKNAIELIGGQVPTQNIPHVYDFFDLADAILQQEVKSTTGSVSKSDH